MPGRRALLWCVLCLGACATAPEGFRDHSDGSGAIRSFHLTGRLAIRQASTSQTALLDWQHDADHDRLALSSPLGTQVMLLQEDPVRVRLTLPDRAPIEARDDAALMESLLGYALPVQGLADWVLGRLPAEAQVRSTGSGAGRVDAFEQSGWSGTLQQWRSVGETPLPGLVTVTRPGLQLKLVVDQWMVQRAEP